MCTENDSCEVNLWRKFTKTADNKEEKSTLHLSLYFKYSQTCKAQKPWGNSKSGEIPKVVDLHRWLSNSAMKIIGHSIYRFIYAGKYFYYSSLHTHIEFTSISNSYKIPVLHRYAHLNINRGPWWHIGNTATSHL